MVASISAALGSRGVAAQPTRAAVRSAASAAAPPRCCAGEQTPAPSRRVALGGALLAALASRASPACARGLDAYIRTPKPPQPLELVAAAVLLAREELTQFGACSAA